MTVRRLNLSVLKEYMTAGELCFIKPLGSKLHRLTYIPERYQKNLGRYKELVEVLNTLCHKFHKGVYYFKIPDMEVLEDVVMILHHMDIMPFFIETSGFGRDDKFSMIPEMFN